MDDPDPFALDLLRVCRRSRIKHRVYAALVAQSPQLPGELAGAAETTIDRVLAVLQGDGDRFRFDSALITLGAVRAVTTPRGVAFSITEPARAASGLIAQRLRAPQMQARGT